MKAGNIHSIGNSQEFVGIMEPAAVHEFIRHIVSFLEDGHYVHKVDEVFKGYHYSEEMIDKIVESRVAMRMTELSKKKMDAD